MRTTGAGVRLYRVARRRKSAQTPSSVAAKRVSVQCGRTRWQKNAFRCSFGRRIGSETGFGAAHAPPSPASAGFACVFRCKNNGKSKLAPSFWHPNGQSGESKPRSLAITAPKPVWLPGRSELLHRNPFGCQMGFNRRTETRRAAVRPVERALYPLGVVALDARRGDAGRAGAPAGSTGHGRGSREAPGARERPPAGLTRRKSHAQRGSWG